MYKRILICDDREDMLEVLSAILREEGGYDDIVLASDAEGCLDEFAAGLIDLAIIDYRMPGKNGAELIKELAASGYREQTKILLCTADGRRTSEEALAVGADAFLLKPFHIDELLELVERLLGLGTGKRKAVLV